MPRVALLALLVAACGGGPPPIAWGSDACDFCRMTITDRRFAAAAITATGRTVRFDALECLAGWEAAQPRPPRAVWVTDATHPGTLIPAAGAEFYRAGAVSAPMGQGFIAVAAGADPTVAGVAPGTAPLRWPAVRDSLLARQPAGS
jgi:copper chaperone NosL